MTTRGRPKSDQKRRQILAAGIEHFQQYGFEHTSLDRVAQAAGVSKQTIYSHFDSKAALMEECIQERCRQSILSPEALDYSLPPERFLGNFARLFIATLCDTGPLSLWRLCASECERNQEIGKAYFNSAPRPVIAAVAEYLRLADERGQLKVPSPAMAASQFLFLAKGLPVDTAILSLEEWPHEFSVEDYTESSVQLFLRAHRP